MSFSPRLLIFHPYNNQVAVAGAKHVQVQDLDMGTAICDIEVKVLLVLFIWTTFLSMVRTPFR